MEAQGGYDQDRFIWTVPRRLVCGICQQVLRDPRLCKDGEHSFCYSCISRYLNESQTCPVCREPLTPKTLVHPQRHLRETLGELVIKCDYIERGCPDHIQLGNLKDHVRHCGFAPVTCEKCRMQINRKDKENHEKSLCQLGAAKCQDCESMKEELRLLKATLAEIKNTQGEMKASLDGIEEHQNVVPAQLDEIMNAHEEYRGSINENNDELKRKHDEMEENLNSMNESLNESKRKRNQLEESLKSMNESVNESERKRNHLENDVREMKQQFEMFAEKFNEVADQPPSNFPSSNKEIIIMGGFDGKEVKKSVSIFNPADKTYAELPPMNFTRNGTSSCVYHNNVIVAGGLDGKRGSDSIEILRINQDLPRWTISNGRLPAKLIGHVLKVYQEKLLVIGGCDCDIDKASNEIHELSFEKPYTPTLLATMPEPRMFHAAEIVDDKLFILGGQRCHRNGDDDVIQESVIVYDFITKVFKTCPSLPKPVSFMSTVTWGKKIIVIGGRNKNEQDSHDVIMYDIESEHWETLPPLRHRRSSHSSAIIDDVIFVFGGMNWEHGYLSSGESFTMSSDGWKELPGMKEKRSNVTAVVKP